MLAISSGPPQDRAITARTWQARGGVRRPFSLTIETAKSRGLN
jgi:hypothetical protein